MNRRGFLKTLAAATAGFTILPPAMTYERVWKATRSQVEILMPLCEFDPLHYAGEWKFITDSITNYPESWLNPVKAGEFPKGVHSNKEITWTNLCLNP